MESAIFSMRYVRVCACVCVRVCVCACNACIHMQVLVLHTHTDTYATTHKHTYTPRQDPDGNTPQDIAETLGHAALAEWLRRERQHAERQQNGKEGQAATHLGFGEVGVLKTSEILKEGQAVAHFPETARKLHGKLVLAS